MAYPIEKQLIPGIIQGKLTAFNFIVAHESGNPKNTGPNSLENELSYMKNNYKNAFTSHWVGGGGRIVQLAEVGKFQYGAGPKANPFSYAHVELARTSNKETFRKDYAAYIWLLRKLATDAGIPKTLDTGSKISDRGIKTHDWITQNVGGTTHVDPYAYLASHGISKDQFKKDVETGLKEVAGVSNVPTLNEAQEKLLNEAKRLKLTDGKEPFGEVNRMYLFSVIVGLAQQVEELKKKVK